MLNTVFIGHFVTRNDKCLYLPSKDFIEAGKFKFKFNDMSEEEAENIVAEY